MKLSIIIPCYNCESTLEEAVESCFVQDVENFEIVMVDDGSTDSTRAVMRRLADKHPEIKLYYHDKNKGGGAARNTAVKYSQAENIFCLDADDVLPEMTISKMIEFLDQRHCDGVTIDRSIKFSGADVHNVHHIDKSPYFGGKIELTSLFSKNNNFSPLYVNFLYTKNAFVKAGGYPTTHGYDTQGFAWRFLCAGLSVYVCPDTEYLHRINYKESYFLREYNNGKMNYNWRDILLEHYYVFSDETLDFICNFDCSDFTRNLMAELLERDNILNQNYESTFGKEPQLLQVKLSKPVYIERNSVRGFYLRIRYKIEKNIMQKLEMTMFKVYRYLYSFCLTPFLRRVNKKAFSENYLEMLNIYSVNKDKYDFKEFLAPQWGKNTLVIEKYFLNNFPFSFLNLGVIKSTMFMYTHGDWKNIQKKFISKYLGRKYAKEVLLEYNLGRPLLNDIEYVTSGNNIHHLYHLLKFFKETNTKSSDINKVIEVGGGYGNMAKIFKKINSESTYIIIDIPIFSYIQAVYLKTIYGRGAVCIVQADKPIIKNGLINIIPLDKKILGSIKEILVDVNLFISTWALSESNEAMQSYIKNVDYFKARYLLIAYQKMNNSFVYSENVKEIGENYDIVFNEETEYVKDNYYLFCKRK